MTKASTILLCSFAKDGTFCERPADHEGAHVNEFTSWLDPLPLKDDPWACQTSCESACQTACQAGCQTMSQQEHDVAAVADALKAGILTESEAQAWMKWQQGLGPFPAEQQPDVFVGCGSEYFNYVCTQARGHLGSHRAFTPHGVLCAQWIAGSENPLGHQQKKTLEAERKFDFTDEPVAVPPKPEGE